jgi:uncharacterized membrane protein
MNKFVTILTTRSDKYGNTTYPLYGVCIGIIAAYVMLYFYVQPKSNFYLYYVITFLLLNLILSIVYSLLERNGKLFGRFMYLWHNDLNYLSEKIKIMLAISATGPIGTIIYLGAIIKAIFGK